MEWYTLRVISGKEKKIRDNILYEVETEGMKDVVTDILVPSENIIEMKDGKKKIRNRVFFPGYLLVNMDMNKETRYLVENITGVMSFVGPQGEPQPVKTDEINRIIGVVESGEAREVIKTLYRVGDHVKVTDGPFLEFSGYVQEVNEDKQKLKVSVSIFGRPTPVELNYLQVELEK
ncbi:MAG: transcription termination/antitermination protein NusG [Candidatus Marinimicrobia bacterium]|jgi:transcriptional antiterminator NusG|nr:transcription termination/antitermination factor NusG [Candidatus Neomarinimicrobiota bacterium]MDP5958066.1 transcription termination/antitermination protein NusG [Candidatus Neomarinimicrobiota bacterium]MDP6230371.1 transcription termination/antitermination protein NusG [Candidatus Neomarinimicrobiota bacterium]MDP6499444.1 transcription termination/antitermination protein NusG [Candidatus Neomarinimicrobiota bacterium]MDP6727098.1 transcription termination/antitermination protein NusG [C|tara:strand:- start:4511 stop:5038 length:528 start_codon:yes stop_codon:yes gene_type:complete